MPNDINRFSVAQPVYLVNPDGKSSSFAQPLIPGAQTFVAGGFRQVTATGTAFSLPTPPAGTRRAIIQAEAQALRWRDDGNNPTASVGMTIPAGGELRYDGADMSALKLIAVAAGAIANVSYYA